MILIDVLVLDGGGAGAVGATIDVFDAANRAMGEKVFDLRFVGRSRRVHARGGLGINTTPFSEAQPRPVVIAPGIGAKTEEEIEARLADPDSRAAAVWLATAAAQGATLAASCTAVFLLAAAGVIGDRRCVTTWWLGPALLRHSPACRVDADQMVVSDRGVWTAGAAFAHVDLLLGLLASLSSSRVSEAVARLLVFDTRTSQASFLIPAHLASRDPAVAELEAHVRGRMDEAHSLASLADRAGMSPRTLARRTDAALGLSPLQLVAKLRLERAIHLLRSGETPLEQVAQQVGFSDVTSLHRLVKRATGSPPGALRLARKRKAGV